MFKFVSICIKLPFPLNKMVVVNNFSNDLVDVAIQKIIIIIPNYKI